MAAPSRFTKVGMSGGSGTAKKKDPYKQIIIAPVDAVASATAQDTGVKLPTRYAVVASRLNVITAEATALAKTVNIGVTGGSGDEFGAALDVSSVGFVSGTNANGSGGTVSYTLAGADFAELEAEIYLEIIAVDEA